MQDLAPGDLIAAQAAVLAMLWQRWSLSSLNRFRQRTNVGADSAAAIHRQWAQQVGIARGHGRLTPEKQGASRAENAISAKSPVKSPKSGQMQISAFGQEPGGCETAVVSTSNPPATAARRSSEQSLHVIDFHFVARSVSLGKSSMMWNFRATSVRHMVPATCHRHHRHCCGLHRRPLHGRRRNAHGTRR